MPSGRILTPTIELELGGATRELVLDMNAIAAAEQATGTSFLLVRNIQRANAGEYSALAWGGLLHAEPELTLQQVRRWINMSNAGYVAGKVLEAVKLSFSTADDDEDAAPLAQSPAPKRTRRAGTRSGASDASTSA